MFYAKIRAALLALSLVFVAIPFESLAQVDQAIYDAMEYRLVGPFRGGRSAAVTGVPGKPNLFYFGATGGGIWQTNDGA